MKKKTVVLIVSGIIVLSVVLLAAICWHQANKVEDIPEMEEIHYDYGCWPIRPDGIMDFCYDARNDEYYLIYQDDEYTVGDTCFVPCADENGCVNIYCSEEEFLDLLKYYSQLDRYGGEFVVPIDSCCYMVFEYSDGCHGRLRWNRSDN